MAFSPAPLFLFLPGLTGRLAEGRPDAPRLKWNTVNIYLLILVQWETIKFLTGMKLRAEVGVAGWG